jgi:signal peptidase I
MPEPLPAPAAVGLDSVPAIAPEVRPSNTRLFCGALLSATLPGTGHFLLSRWRKGIFLLLVFALWFLGYWWLRLPQTVYGVLVTFPAAIGWCVFATWDAAYAGKRPGTMPSQWWLAALLPAALLAGVVHSNWELRASGFGTFSMTGSSMAPAIPEGSHLMVDRWYFRQRAPHRDDIVVFPSATKPGVLLVKRVIAVGGETIKVEGETVLINGKAIVEPYARFEGSSNELPWVVPTILPAGKLFVMGDNRHLSFDSRYKEFRLVDVSSVRGKVIYTLPSLGSEIKYFD